MWFSAFAEHARFAFTVLNSRGSATFIVAFLTLPLLLIIYALFKGDLTDYALLKHGKCVVGQVTSQRRVRGRRGSRSEICYSLPVGPGRPMTGCGTDWTGYYLKDMRVLVFYDPEDFSKHVAYCCADWIVRLEDGTFLEP
jgi:hypothetical protein